MTIGILLTNLGTPDAPTTQAVRRYLAEFLSDPRVIELPKIVWHPILHGIVLRTRPHKSAENYKKIWTEKGSPLLANSILQAEHLQKILNQKVNQPIKVALAMRYGNPSIASQIAKLQEAGIKRILVFPLYPQYSAATTASTFDAIAKSLKKMRHIPELRFVTNYFADNGYLHAISNSIQSHWEKQGRKEHLLFSFHGLPQYFVDRGDPYAEQCHTTAKWVAENLGIEKNKWSVVFQSRFGATQWLQPYCDKTLQAMPGKGIKSVEVVCPGFSADCLETLEEIVLRNHELFKQAGGEQFAYIPAMNANEEHIQALAEIALRHIKGWVE